MNYLVDSIEVQMKYRCTKSIVNLSVNVCIIDYQFVFCKPNQKHLVL